MGLSCNMSVHFGMQFVISVHGGKCQNNNLTGQYCRSKCKLYCVKYNFIPTCILRASDMDQSHYNVYCRKIYEVLRIIKYEAVF